MLYDFMDFARVLHTLSKLSQCSITVKKKPNIPGFPNIANSVNRRTLSSTNYGADPEQPEEEIYRYLPNKNNMHSVLRQLFVYKCVYSLQDIS